MLNKTLVIYNKKKAGQWSAQKFDLVGSGAPFGRVWERSWEGFGGSGGLLGRLGGSFFHACIQDGLQKWSWRPLGCILARF